MRIFGREPTVVLQAVSAVAALVVSFGVDWLSAEQAGAVIAVLAAVLGAVNSALVRPVAPAAFTAVVTAGAALLSAYGLSFTQEQVGAATAVVIGVLALLTRVQVSPAPPDSPVA